MARPKFRLSLEWDEYKKKVDSGEWQAHVYPKGFVFTEIRQFPKEKVCLVHFLGGKDFDDWKEGLVSDLVAFGKKHGCTVLEAVCRLGLEKKLKPLGWKRWHVLIRKDIL